MATKKRLQDDYQMVVSGQIGVAAFLDAVAKKDISIFAGTTEGQLEEMDQELREYPETQDDYIAGQLRLFYNECARNLNDVIKMELGYAMICRRLATLPHHDPAVLNEKATQSDIRLQSFLHEADQFYERADNLDEKPSAMLPQLLIDVQKQFENYSDLALSQEIDLPDIEKSIGRNYLNLALLQTQITAMLVTTRVVFFQEYPKQIDSDGNKFVIDAIKRELYFTRVMSMYANQACDDIPEVVSAIDNATQKPIPMHLALH